MKFRTLGGSNSRPTPAGKCHEVEVEYALTTAHALLCASKTNLDTGESIRFLFISGIMSVRDQKKSLWMLEEGRKARVGNIISLDPIVNPILMSRILSSSQSKTPQTGPRRSRT